MWSFYLGVKAKRYKRLPWVKKCKEILEKKKVYDEFLFYHITTLGFRCNIAITNFIVSHTCEIRLHDVIDRTVQVFTWWRHPVQKFQSMAKWVYFGPFFFIYFAGFNYVMKRIWHSLTVDKILLNPPWKMSLSSQKARLIFFKTRLTLSSIYIQFNPLKKNTLGKHCGKRWNCSKWAISLFPTMFTMQSVC